MDIDIRRATMAEEGRILQLASRLLAFGPPPWRDIDRMHATDNQVLRDAIREKSEESLVWVATADDSVIAFIHLTLTTDYYTQAKTAHVADLVVAEGAEGRGVAGQLLAKAEKWARSLDSPWLSIAVFESNTRAAALYERLGFQREIVRMVMPLQTITKSDRG